MSYEFITGKRGEIMKKFKNKTKLIEEIMSINLDKVDAINLYGLPCLDDILEKKSMKELKQLYEKQIDFLKELHFILFTNYRKKRKNYEKI
jgi:hypothetical protein